MKKSFIIMASVYLFCSCASRVNVLKPEGEKATLTLPNLAVLEIEILAISDSLLYVTNGKKIIIAHLSDVRSVHIHGYRVPRASKVLAAIPPVLFEGIVMLTALGVDQPVWGMIAMITIGGTIYGFTSGDPKVNFSFPLEINELEKLRLYCRYPQGLTNEQWKDLLQQLNQEDFYLLTVPSR